MTAQLSPMRTGRVTASRAASIIGVDKYRTDDDTIREMARDELGAEPEFTGSDATEWGNAHEEDARAAYEQRTGQLVLDAQDFIVHPEHDWIGVSPDGLVGPDGMAEFKCPYRAAYTSIAEKPEYYAQVQLQLAVTGRAWCDFVMWRSFDQADRLGVEPLIIERVEADPDWFGTHLPTLQAFIDRYRAIIADPELAAEYLTDLDRDDVLWRAAAAEFRAADEAVRAAGVRLDLAKDQLRELAGDRSAKGCGVQVIRSERAGSVDWRQVAQKYAPDADAEAFRRPTSVVWTVKECS